MLETLDVLVGLAVVMLVVSFAVTVITQIVTSILNLRGQALRQGVANLLLLIDRGVDATTARKVADNVLRDPLVGGRTLWPLRLALASVVHREELTKLLLGYALDPGQRPLSPKRPLDPDPGGLTPLHDTIRASLANNGVADANATLQAIRTAVLELEKTNPELSSAERTNIAILNFAKSDFIGKLNAWFDQTVDRASDTFTGWTHFTAVVVAIFVAFGMQLDTVGLIDRLSTDQAVRTKLVDWAISNTNSLAPALAQPAAPTDATGPAAASNALPGAEPVADSQQLQAAKSQAATALAEAARDALSNERLIVLNFQPHIWWRRWSASVSCADAARLKSQGNVAGLIGDECPLPQVNGAGVLLSAILLSLGGPFWYAALKNLLKLRSVLASKDDDDRETRQSSQAPAGSGGPNPAPKPNPIPPELAGGEAGDLTALG